MADTCDANASCHNIFCLFGCHCDIGWIGDGKECQHICTIDPCDGNAICLQNASSSQGYQCYCNPGWTGNGVSQCMPKLDRNATKQWHFVKDVFVNVSDLDYDMVAAYDENADQDVITLLGGHNYPSNRYIFNISSHEIILVDSIPDLNIKSNGQNSVIINDLLYYSLEGKLHNIDLGTFKPSTIQKKMLETHNECITSDHENNIFMIGGTSYIARNGGSFTVYEYLQIYNIPGGQWFLGVNLTQPRFSGSCAYWKAQDTLYYFGGYVGVRHNMLRDVVVLRSVSSKNNSWKAAASTLTAKVSGTHAFVSSKHQIILIIGIVGRHEFPFCNEFHLLGEHITNCQPFNNMFYQKFTPIYLANYDRIYAIGGWVVSRKRGASISYSTANSLLYRNIESHAHCDATEYTTHARSSAHSQNKISVVDEWILTNETFDFEARGIIIGYSEQFDKDNIVILVYSAQMTYTYQYVFNIPSGTLFKYPNRIDYLRLSPGDQSYVTLKHNIYWRFNEELYIYNMLTFEKKLVPGKVHETNSDCVTSDGENYIYLIGSIYVQIYNIDSGEWTLGQNLPFNWIRGSCIYWKERNSLYIFGGEMRIPIISDPVKPVSDRITFTDRIVSLSNITNTNSVWEVLGARLTSETENGGYTSTFAFIDDHHRTVFIIGLVKHQKSMLCNEFILGEERI
eukprot:818375_1